MIESDMPAEARLAAAARIETIRTEKSLKTEGLKNRIAAEKDRQPIAVSRLMTEIKKVMTPHTVIVDDCWTSSAMLRQVLDLTEHNTFFRARKGGSIRGQGCPWHSG